MPNQYKIKRTDKQFELDGNWDKTAWHSIEPLAVTNDNGWTMDFKPGVNVKLLYDDTHIYLIYKVEDRYVKCVTDKINGPVWKDSCVEFFFAPNVDEPNKYFNLEINCGGTALMSYQKNPRTEYVSLSEDDIKQIKIVHSLPKVVGEEILEPINWIIEIGLPIKILESYSKISFPSAGVNWKANFYKCAENNSHPHWISWTEIKASKPDFHQPAYFGIIEFE